VFVHSCLLDTVKCKLTVLVVCIFLHRSVIDFEEMAAGLNKRRMIQSAVFKELVKVCKHFCFAVSSCWIRYLLGGLNTHTILTGIFQVDQS